MGVHKNTLVIIMLAILVIVLGLGVSSIIIINNNPVITKYSDNCPTVATLRYTESNDIVKIRIDELDSYGNTTIIWEGDKSNISDIKFIVSAEGLDIY